MEIKQRHRWHQMGCYTGMYDDKETGKSFMTVLNEWVCEDCKRKKVTPEGFPPENAGECRFVPKDFGKKKEALAKQLNTEVVHRHGKKKKKRRNR